MCRNQKKGFYSGCLLLSMMVVEQPINNRTLFTNASMFAFLGSADLEVETVLERARSKLENLLKSPSPERLVFD